MLHRYAAQFASRLCKFVYWLLLHKNGLVCFFALVNFLWAIIGRRMRNNDLKKIICMCQLARVAIMVVMIVVALSLEAAFCT